jgi:aspartate carbamoyltransferase catalytic subunit
MSAEDITLILDTAESFKEISLRSIKKVPTLRGKTIINVFFEASTRTRTSFEIAGKRLSADTVNISASTSAVVKGETLEDTAKNLEAMKPDIIVMRHSCSGAPHYLAERCDFSVVNAGDGAHEHPSQALLDLLTMRQHKGRIEGLTVAIIGDITHSRVVRSNVYALGKLGAQVRLCGPGTMIPPGIERLGAQVFNSIDEAVSGADVVMMLRIQQERQGKTMLPSLREYSMFYGLTPERMKLAKTDALVMHPGPMNRGVEISSAVADGPQNVILDQVENGVAVRMALLYLVSGGDKLEDSAQ